MSQSLMANCDVRRRQIPAQLRLQWLFGGAISQICGWLFLGLGMFFVAQVIPKSDLWTLYQFHGVTARQAQGTVVSTWDTKVTVNDATTYGVRYTFSPADGPVQQGTAYTRGSRPGNGASVTVEYRPDTPSISRVTDMGAPFPVAGAMLFLLFPLFGLGFLISHWRKWLRIIAVLRCGVTTSGRFQNITPTRVRYFGRRLFAAFFAFTTPEGGEYTAKYYTTNPKSAWRNGGYYAAQVEEISRMDTLGKILTVGKEVRDAADKFGGKRGRKQEPDEEPIIYDPARPTRAALLCELGDDAELTDTAVRGGSLPHALAMLLLPALAVLACIYSVLQLLQG